MKNPYEKQQHIPTPRNEAQFEETNQGRFSKFFDEALIKAEGFILYAPIAQELKDILLSKLTAATDREIVEISILVGQNSSEEQAAAIIFQRRLRSTIDSMKQELKPIDYTMLCVGVERLARTDQSSFDDLYAEWMGGGLN